MGYKPTNLKSTYNLQITLNKFNIIKLIYFQDEIKVILV